MVLDHECDAYCVAAKVSAGIVMHSDTRTNVGIDNTSRFSKMFTFEKPVERVIAVMTAVNFNEATRDTPFFQIGERKYSTPVLDRLIVPETEISNVVKACCVSMESTMRSNFSVGMPLDLLVTAKDGLVFSQQQRIEFNDAGFAAIARHWHIAIEKCFRELPRLDS